MAIMGKIQPAIKAAQVPIVIKILSRLPKKVKNFEILIISGSFSFFSSCSSSGGVSTGTALTFEPASASSARYFKFFLSESYQSYFIVLMLLINDKSQQSFLPFNLFNIAFQKRNSVDNKRHQSQLRHQIFFPRVLNIY
ncbi:hypothetical protein FGO68_gene10493 [Halteria grandinella]|uniref:Uncharacterized protein n=1 Tax=Halteria grandinella TaxID=5974 RepID=A0A8J8P688_HALGN|nr:hypothetical protein FGO68_gene10493 [Halteria grandinella]